MKTFKTIAKVLSIIAGAYALLDIGAVLTVWRYSQMHEKSFFDELDEVWNGLGGLD